MKNNLSIGIIGGMGPQAGLFAHELILEHSRLVWPGNFAEFPYYSSLNFASC
jgi:aspartate/glutamate racemase